MSKFKVGDRVRLLTVEATDLKPGHLGIVKGYYMSGIVRVEWDAPFNSGHNSDGTCSPKRGWNVNDEELELVTKGGEVKPYQRKTYRLVKDAPNVRKGAIYQDQCEDGTQPFELITKEFLLGSHAPESHIIHSRELVEDNPKWFEEVFKVTPEYMTQAELDQWEAFKKSKNTRSKKVAKKKQ